MRIPVILAIAGCFSLGNLSAQEKVRKEEKVVKEEKKVTVTPTTTSAPKEKAKVNWVSFTEAVELNKKEPRKIFIDVYTTWCGPCKMMDANTFTDPVIIEYLNKYYYPVKLNAEMTDTVVFNNVTFVNPNPGQTRSPHQLASSLLNGKMMYPTTVYLDEEFKMLGPVPGYLKPADIEPILVFYGENNHKKTTWDEFVKTYQAKTKTTQ